MLPYNVPPSSLPRPLHRLLRHASASPAPPAKPPAQPATPLSSTPKGGATSGAREPASEPGSPNTGTAPVASIGINANSMSMATTVRPPSALPFALHGPRPLPHSLAQCLPHGLHARAYPRAHPPQHHQPHHQQAQPAALPKACRKASLGKAGKVVNRVNLSAHSLSLTVPLAPCCSIPLPLPARGLTATSPPLPPRMLPKGARDTNVSERCCLPSSPNRRNWQHASDTSSKFSFSLTARTL